MQLDLDFTSAMNQFWTVLEENGNRRSLTSAYLLYGHLVHLWSSCGRPASFRRLNTLICSTLSISKPTLDRQRQILKSAGLIEFFSKGKGDQNITYIIKNAESSSKNILLLNAEKLKNITSPVTSPVTSYEYINSNSIELIIVIKGEVKNFNYLETNFLHDPGIAAHWVRHGNKKEEWPAALKIFADQNHGKEYPSILELRKHVMNWIPYHTASKSKDYGRTKSNRGFSSKQEPRTNFSGTGGY